MKINDNQSQSSHISRNSQKSQSSMTSSVPSNCFCDYKNFKKPKLRFQGETTNQTAYKAYKIQKPQQHEMPKVIQKSYDKDMLVSSYKNQFKKPQISNDNFGYANGSGVIQYEYKPKKAPFYSETQYTKTFIPKPMAIEKQPQYVYKPKNTKFQGQSSYRAEFNEKKPTNDSIIVAAQDSLQNSSAFYQRNKPKIPFEGQSSYKNTYVKHDVKPQKQSEYKYEPKNSKFQGASSYKSAFPNYGQSAYKSDLQYCPAHPNRIATKIN